MKREKSPQPAIELVFRGAGSVPEKLPLNVITQSLGAVQRLAGGLDVERAVQTPETLAVATPEMDLWSEP